MADTGPWNGFLLIVYSLAQRALKSTTRPTVSKRNICPTYTNALFIFAKQNYSRNR